MKCVCVVVVVVVVIIIIIVIIIVVVPHHIAHHEIERRQQHVEFAIVQFGVPQFITMLWRSYNNHYNNQI
jgi:hypothetical protein